jgi:two-component system cell cycle response regulator DivK
VKVWGKGAGFACSCRCRPDRLKVVRILQPERLILEEDSMDKNHLHNDADTVGKKHILIVEDDGKNMKLLRDILNVSGYVTIEAGDGRKAVELAKEKKPDLILMDIQLPFMDGLEATKLIRADPATQHIPIFALTAFAMGGDRERFIQAGCDDYLSKPYNIKELLEKVKKILGG